MDRGQVAIADFLCTSCMQHRRVTGRALVRDFLSSDPIGAHRTVCTHRKGTP
ncbi:MAG TPA: transcription factor WhiB [Methylomirabilota bacterium]|nr:transcription factor WhiB [Methylomirabilota bacterium]